MLEVSGYIDKKATNLKEKSRVMRLFFYASSVV